MEDILRLLVDVIAGLIAGGVACFVLYKVFGLYDTPIGTIRIDTSDPDGPFLFLELEHGVDFLLNKKKATVLIEAKDYVSHK